MTDARMQVGRGASGPKLLVLDASYTLEMIRARGIEQSVLCRDLGGFFAHVWSAHPFASLLTSSAWGARSGAPDVHELSARHTFIEGKIGRYQFLERLPLVNFLTAQTLLFLYLIRLVRREGICAIRVGDPLYLGLFGLALARLCRIPLVIRVNGNNAKIRANTAKPLYPRLFRTAWIEERIERFVFPRADLIAAPNQDNVDFALSAGARPDRVTIFRYGNLLAREHLIDPDQRSRDNALFEVLGVTPGNYILCVGRLQALKFPDDAVRILGEIVRRGFDLKLVFAGDGEMRAELTSLANSEGVPDRIVFAGYQNQHALAQLNTFAASVVSPLTGRALSESALCGAAIVAYDLDWQGDLIKSGETGELVPFREWRALADGVERYLRAPAHARAMGRNARRHALAMLDPEALDEHERDEYAKLLGLAGLPKGKPPHATSSDAEGVARTPLHVRTKEATRDC